MTLEEKWLFQNFTLKCNYTFENKNNDLKAHLSLMLRDLTDAQKFVLTAMTERLYRYSSSSGTYITATVMEIFTPEWGKIQPA